MESLSIKSEIHSYVTSVTYSDKSKIKSDTLLFKEGYFDSMGFISLIAFLEERFGITTSDTDLVEENFESIEAITQFVANKKFHKVHSPSN